ncbi:MAG: MBL fold metallo-hydrolase, partial [Bryobacter sp.]|nr:MBL fold metallo-hydrolase [Bryobacter sp.]
TLALLAAGVLFAQDPGAVLPPWTPGTLDIHQIHTGRGNAALLVFPDRTTLLLDAGAVPDRNGPELGPLAPPGVPSPAEAIRQYVLRHAPALDYALATHYHDDHIGALPHLAARIPIRTLIDRGLDPPPPSFPVVQDYLAFRRRFPGHVLAGRAGRADQILPRHAAIPEFELRTVAANGVVWTGRGDDAVPRFPPGWRDLPPREQPNENHFSIALRLRYGPFRYFTGGDLIGVVLDDLPAWHDLETPAAAAVGPVDVAVLNHHGFLDTTNPFFLATLRPRAVVIPAWHATHPDHSVLRRLRSPAHKPAPPLIFTTSLLPATQAIVSYLGDQAFQSRRGHIVVRVAPGGASYRIYVLDAESPQSPVISTHGPFSIGL